MTSSRSLVDIQAAFDLTRKKARKYQRGDQASLADIDLDRVQLNRVLLRRQEVLERLIAKNKNLERRLIREAERRKAAEEIVETERLPRHSVTPRVSAKVPSTTTLPYIVDPTSVIYRPPPPPPASPPNVKAGVIDMMMMQNAQMHQLMMHQMMLSAIPKVDVPHPLSPQLSTAPPPISSRSNKDVDIVELLRANSKPAPTTIHHHHYNPPRSLPAAPPEQPAHTHYKKSPSIFNDDQIMKPTRFWSPVPSDTGSTKAPQQKPISQIKPRKYNNSVLIKRFRRAAFVALFVKILQGGNAKLLFALRTPVFSDEFMARIRVRECIGVLHRYYLREPGKIGAFLKTLISDSAIDLTAPLMDSSTKEEQEAVIKTLASCLENVVYFITDIMPADGILGTNAKALLQQLLQPGHVFPTGYFWTVEKELLKFDYRDRPTTVDERDAFIVLIGLFVGRALLRTLLAIPEKYGIVNRVGHRARQNLRMLGTMFASLIRRVYVQPKDKPLAMPAELSSSLYTDEEVKPVFKRLKTSFEYSEKILRDWGREYVKRMRDIPT